MGIFEPSFVADLESRLRWIEEQEFTRALASENQWWEPFAKVLPSEAAKELVFWILSTATIELQGKGGNIQFDDMTVLETDFTALDAGKGLRVRRQQFEDLQGGLLSKGEVIAKSWVAQQSAYAAYWKQKKTAELIVNGEAATSLAYDKLTFFNTAHLLNPKDSTVGTFSNLFTGAASGAFPGALKIDESVALDVAVANVGKAVAYIKGIKMPNGKDPRFLRPRYLVVPPALMNRGVLLTDAKQIAMASTGGAGSVDVSGLIERWGLKLVVADELGYAITGTAADDTSWYIGCEQIAESELGSFVYVEREAFGINFYTGQGGAGVTGIDAILSRAQELEWHQHGRNVGGYGHPHYFFKAKAA
jgi:hypothetical protein